MLEQQHTERFIGRSAEIATFKHWLADPNAPEILYIHDAAEDADKKGGVGKSWLLQEYARIVAQEQPDIAIVTVDFFNIGDRDRIFLAEKIVASIEQLYPSWIPDEFHKAIHELRTQEQQVNPLESSETKWRDVLSAALADDLRRLDARLLEEHKMLLVFFDTFEAIEQDPYSVVMRQSETFPDTYYFPRMRSIIAGRNKLDWTHTNWRGREQEVQIIALRPFNEQEMLEYVENESTLEIAPASERLPGFHERTEGRPIIIGLAIDVLNRRILTLDNMLKVPKADFESYLVPQINQLENPINWVILFMAHVYHHFNFSILEWILTDVTTAEHVVSISRERFTAALPALSFIRRPGSGEDFVLHDEMRRLVTKYCWEILDTDQRNRKDISQGMIRYFEQAMRQSLPEQRRQSFTVELLYHRLFVDPDAGMSYFLDQFQNASRFSKPAFARLLLQEAQKFIHLLSSEWRSELQFAEVRLLRQDESSIAALELLNQLEREGDAHWLADNRSRVLLEKARCFARQSKLLEAFQAYEQCLAIQRKKNNEVWQALLLRSMGAILRRRGQFSRALDYYEQSIALYKKLGNQIEYATSLTNLSSLYRSQGRIQEALRTCRVALRLRQELLQAGQVSEVQVGLSLHALGVIYLYADNIVEAELNFRESLELYLRANYKTGIATTHNRYGEVHMKKGELERARTWFVLAQEESREIDTEQYINSLNKQGRVATQLGKWEEAEAFFAQAIAVCRQVPDYYQQAENLIDLANVLLQMKRNELLELQLQEAEAIAKEENYLNLLGRIEQIRGEKDYAAQAYVPAFLHFVSYCGLMAQYNDSEYKTALEKVTGAVLGIPKQEVSAVVQELIKYWKDQHLDQVHPDFVEAFSDLGELMSI